MNITYVSNVSSTLLLKRNTFRSNFAIKLSTYKLENKYVTMSKRTLALTLKLYLKFQGNVCNFDVT